jgi:hypothetical protein
MEEYEIWAVVARHEVMTLQRASLTRRPDNLQPVYCQLIRCKVPPRRPHAGVLLDQYRFFMFTSPSINLRVLIKDL